MKREKGSLLGSTAMKVLAAVLALVFSAITAGSVTVAAFMIDEGIYFRTEEEMREQVFQREADQTAQSAFHIYIFSQKEQDWHWQFLHTNVIGFTVNAEGRAPVTWGDTTSVEPYRSQFRFQSHPEGGIHYWLHDSFSEAADEDTAPYQSAEV